MKPLCTKLRRDLERTIIEAREVAVQGSQAALEALTVHDGKKGSHLNSSAAILRNRLRAHARQIGDRRNSQTGAQAIDRLVQECAYEHWHRMIFARFLAENGLLVEPESQLAVSLEDVEGLARDEGINRWELAGQYAQQALPAIFRPDDPLLQLTLPREIRLQLDDLLDELPRETFLADDSLGWVYQFWQSAEKERVNKEGDKITGETLSAVTQLFTEHYMVLFLLHNTIGAWHAGKVLAEQPTLAASAKSENELREALSLTEAGGYDFEYLRFVREPQDSDGDGESSGPWRPMGGTFDGWPKRTEELKVLDPCCGSGHFLVAAFELLLRLRMHEEGLSLEAAVDSVIQDNLFGLELDPRCTQIAAFNVAVAAWKLTDPRPLPAMKNIACTGISVGVPREQWMQALDSDGSSNLRFYFGQLHDMFSNAATLGSLINPNRFLGSHTLKDEDTRRLSVSLEHVISRDPATSPEEHELGVAAQGLSRAAELLSSRYHVVITNVPYLGRGRQDSILMDHLDTYYEAGKADLATAFLLRSVEFCKQNGTLATVTPQNWLFLTTYANLRERLLSRYSWNVVARLGSGAFETVSGQVVNVALIAITASEPDDTSDIAGIDVSVCESAAKKSNDLKVGGATRLHVVKQSEQFLHPDARIIIEPRDSSAVLLLKSAQSFLGLGTGDYPHYGRYFWEVAKLDSSWAFQQCSVKDTVDFGGREHIVAWEPSIERVRGMTDGERQQIHNQDQSGQQAWYRDGVAVSLMQSLPVTRYTGEKFEKALAVLIANRHEDLPALWEFCTTPEFCRLVRQLDQKLIVTNGTLVKIPFNLDYWKEAAEKRYPSGLPDPESDDPTQWIFHGRPEPSASQNQVVASRLLGYRWPAESDRDLRLSRRAQKLVHSCESLLSFADEDGVVCIPSVRGEETATARLTQLFDACDLHPPHKLDDWLRNDFFKEHCEFFKQRPFIWHIWDGRKADGFHALINYHKLAEQNGHKLLENLTYSYLGDWINRQESDVKRGEAGADGRLAAAKILQERLVSILNGEPPFDIFVRWKPLHEQPIGWNPDINDGVRINIRPFMAVDIPGGRKGAGILRFKPKVKWTKDRGKEPKRPRDKYPWFWSWDESIDFPGSDTYSGERWNDCHYKIKAKQAARKRMVGNDS